MLEQINKFYTERYTEIIRWSNNCLKKIKRQDLQYELATECYLYLVSNIDMIEETVNKNVPLESIIKHWLKMQPIWVDTILKRKYIYRKNHSSAPIENLTGFNQADEELDEEELLAIEKDKIDKLSLISYNLKQLPLEQQLLFDDVFNKGLDGSGKLSRHLGIPRTAAHLELKKLKSSLSKGYKNNTE